MSAGITSNVHEVAGAGADDTVTPSEVTVKAGGNGVRGQRIALCTSTKNGAAYYFYFSKNGNDKWHRMLNYVLDAVSDGEDLITNEKNNGTDIGNYKEVKTVKPA